MRARHRKHAAISGRDAVLACDIVHSLTRIGSSTVDARYEYEYDNPRLTLVELVLMLEVMQA